LRDQFEVSSPELDAMVIIASRVPGVIGARMTGAGFGGCTVNLVRRTALDEFSRRIQREYRALTGLSPRVIVVEPAQVAGYMQ
jgi:galactokinase